jgi:hypothetical protein
MTVFIESLAYCVIGTGLSFSQGILTRDHPSPPRGSSYDYAHFAEAATRERVLEWLIWFSVWMLATGNVLFGENTVICASHQTYIYSSMTCEAKSGLLKE